MLGRDELSTRDQECVGVCLCVCECVKERERDREREREREREELCQLKIAEDIRQGEKTGFSLHERRKRHLQFRPRCFF